ncbi:MAG TPA: hypothetical protein VGM80_05955 [Gaiellaceae bacterium]
MASLGAFAGYAAISFVYFGLPLMPHPGRDLIGNGQQLDPEIFTWSFAWWPHALTSWTNPLFTHAIYAPQGINLTWTTSVPVLAYVFWPVTAAFGPAVAFNVAAIVLPALAAWTAFLLCRHLTGSVWASLVGGYLFGFSSYILGHQLAGHLNLTAVFLLPLAALAVIRFVQGELGGRGLAVRLGLLLALQLGISTEVALTLTVVLALCLALAGVFVREWRPRLRASVVPLLGAYAIGGALASPLLIYALRGFVPSDLDPYHFSSDLFNLVIPTRTIAFGGPLLKSVSNSFLGNDDERGSYLGLPAILIVFLWSRKRWGIPASRFLTVALVATAILAIGTGLRVFGYRLIPFPWAVAARLPLIDGVLPQRFAVYVSLACAVIVALWISSTAGRRASRPVLLPVLAVAALVPALWHHEYRQHPSRPSFFASGAYRTCVPRGSRLLLFPFGRWGDSMLWQAESGFWFSMAEGDMGRDHLPKSFVADPVAERLTLQFVIPGHPQPPPSIPALEAFAQSHGVERIVTVDGQTYPTAEQLTQRGTERLDDVTVSPRCT